MRRNHLLAALAIIGLLPVPGIALAQSATTCDPNGPRGAFAAGIPAADNPAWCDRARPGLAMAAEPAPERIWHARRLRHRY
jgi:hypothetical protein